MLKRYRAAQRDRLKQEIDDPVCRTLPWPALSTRGVQLPAAVAPRAVPGEPHTGPRPPR